MKKALRNSILLVFAFVLGTGMAVAGDLALVTPQAPVLMTPVSGAEALAPLALELFTPEPQAVAICPLLGCVNDQYCRRDRDCTTAPGGVCNLFCPTRGCCSYPSP
jgi:hypothetical protein